MELMIDGNIYVGTVLARIWATISVSVQGVSVRGCLSGSSVSGASLPRGVCVQWASLSGVALRQRPPWSETPGQRPRPPCEQTDTHENIPFPNFVCGR